MKDAFAPSCTDIIAVDFKSLPLHVVSKLLLYRVPILKRKTDILIYTNGTKKLWDFNIAADVQEWSKIQIYVDMHVTEDILKTSTQNGKEVVVHILHMKHGGKEG